MRFVPTKRRYVSAQSSTSTDVACMHGVGAAARWCITSEGPFFCRSLESGLPDDPVFRGMASSAGDALVARFAGKEGTPTTTSSQSEAWGVFT